ncbi:MAG: ubiquinol-cytochrome c reductase iron-sulfur subunit N-terminal domain-containing protein, partial [Novosphingobium sp.]
MSQEAGTAAPAGHQTASLESASHVPAGGVRRRDFINIAAVSAAGVGGIAPLVSLVPAA